MRGCSLTTCVSSHGPQRKTAAERRRVRRAAAPSGPARKSARPAADSRAPRTARSSPRDRLLGFHRQQRRSASTMTVLLSSLPLTAAETLPASCICGCCQRAGRGAAGGLAGVAGVAAVSAPAGTARPDGGSGGSAACAAPHTSNDHNSDVRRLMRIATYRKSFSSWLEIRGSASQARGSSTTTAASTSRSGCATVRASTRRAGQHQSRQQAT